MDFDSRFVVALLSMFHSYQQTAKITGECITNVRSFIDLVHSTTKYKATAKAVMCIGRNKQTDSFNCCYGHVVVHIDGFGDIDPSWEIHRIPEKHYFTSFGDVSKRLDSKLFGESKQTLLKSHLHFIEVANKMNNNEFLIHDRIHYHRQLDFITLTIPCAIELIKTTKNMFTL